MAKRCCPRALLGSLSSSSEKISQRCITATRPRRMATAAAAHCEPSHDSPPIHPTAPAPSAQHHPPRRRRDELKKAPPCSAFLTDNFNRQHDYLRISVTERCNLRCLYCMPEEGVPLSPPSHLLTSPEIFYLSSLFVSQGVTKIRLTGGEPTVRRDIVPLMHSIGSLRSKGLRELAITTNGISLHRKLDSMVDAGLTAVNLSLDTLDPFQFQIMTRRKGFDAVMTSMRRILEMNKLGAGIKLKINCVVMRGVNEREILRFVEMGRTEDVEVRFIEYMPFEGNKWSQGKMVSYGEMLDKIRAEYPDIYKVRDHSNDTSKTFRVPGFLGKVGFITSMTHNFCGTCNRLRITSDGNLKVCLFGNSEVSLRDLLRKGNNNQPIDEQAFEAHQRVGDPTKQPMTNAGLPFGWAEQEKELLNLIGLAVKRKKEKHAGIGELENMKNRPMILIDVNPHPLPSLQSAVSSTRMFTLDAYGSAMSKAIADNANPTRSPLQVCRGLHQYSIRPFHHRMRANALSPSLGRICWISTQTAKPEEDETTSPMPKSIVRFSNRSPELAARWADHEKRQKLRRRLGPRLLGALETLDQPGVRREEQASETKPSALKVSALSLLRQNVDTWLPLVSDMSWEQLLETSEWNLRHRGVDMQVADRIKYLRTLYHQLIAFSKEYEDRRTDLSQDLPEPLAGCNQLRTMDWKQLFSASRQDLRERDVDRVVIAKLRRLSDTYMQLTDFCKEYEEKRKIMTSPISDIAIPEVPKSDFFEDAREDSETSTEERSKSERNVVLDSPGTESGSPQTKIDEAENTHEATSTGMEHFQWERLHRMRLAQLDLEIKVRELDEIKMKTVERALQGLEGYMKETDEMRSVKMDRLTNELRELRLVVQEMDTVGLQPLKRRQQELEVMFKGSDESKSKAVASDLVVSDRLEKLETDLATVTNTLTELEEKHFRTMSNRQSGLHERIRLIEDIRVPALGVTVADVDERMRSIEDTKIPTYRSTVEDLHKRVTILESKLGPGNRRKMSSLTTSDPMEASSSDYLRFAPQPTSAALETQPRLTHTDSAGAAHMVDVGDKSHTRRVAVAHGIMRFGEDATYTLTLNNQMAKGDVLGAARIAGISAAKRTSELIPLCHPLALTSVSVDLSLIPPEASQQKVENGLRCPFGGVDIKAKVECVGQTGVEMEALTAATVAGLTVYDMCKAVDKKMVLSSVKVVEKRGGKSGDWVDEVWRMSMGKESVAIDEEEGDEWTSGRYKRGIRRFD